MATAKPVVKPTRKTPAKPVGKKTLFSFFSPSASPVADPGQSDTERKQNEQNNAQNEQAAKKEQEGKEAENARKEAEMDAWRAERFKANEDKRKQDELSNQKGTPSAKKQPAAAKGKKTSPSQPVQLTAEEKRQKKLDAEQKAAAADVRIKEMFAARDEEKRQAKLKEKQLQKEKESQKQKGLREAKAAAEQAEATAAQGSVLGLASPSGAQASESKVDSLLTPMSGAVDVAGDTAALTTLFDEIATEAKKSVRSVFQDPSGEGRKLVEELLTKSAGQCTAEVLACIVHGSGSTISELGKEIADIVAKYGPAGASVVASEIPDQVMLAADRKDYGADTNSIWVWELKNKTAVPHKFRPPMTTALKDLAMAKKKLKCISAMLTLLRRQGFEAKPKNLEMYRKRQDELAKLQAIPKPGTTASAADVPKKEVSLPTRPQKELTEEEKQQQEAELELQKKKLEEEKAALAERIRIREANVAREQAERAVQAAAEKERKAAAKAAGREAAKKVREEERDAEKQRKIEERAAEKLRKEQGKVAEKLRKEEEKAAAAQAKIAAAAERRTSHQSASQKAQQAQLQQKSQLQNFFAKAGFVKGDTASPAKAAAAKPSSTQGFFPISNPGTGKCDWPERVCSADSKFEQGSDSAFSLDTSVNDDAARALMVQGMRQRKQRQKSKGQRTKFLFFDHEDKRPPFYGHKGIATETVTGRHPLRKEAQIDYEYDSEGEWDEPEEGE